MNPAKAVYLAHAIKHLKTARFHLDETLKLLEAEAASVGRLNMSEAVETVAFDRLGDARVCLENADEALRRE